MVRSQECSESATSGETKEPQPIGCSLNADMVNSSCGTEPQLDKFTEHQGECEAVQFKESDPEVSLCSAVEQEVVSGPVVTVSDVTQDNAVSNNLQSTEESASLHEIDIIEVLPEIKQANVTTLETEEPSTDIKNYPEDQLDLECPVIKPLVDLDVVENETETTPCPEPQTSHKDQSSPKSFHEHSLDVHGDSLLFQEIEETSVDKEKARNYHPDRLSGATLQHSEEMHFSTEILLQATEEILEPPAKKRLRKRMGMCGLGDRKRRFPFDGQQCRPGLIGRQRENEALKENKGAQYLHNIVLENDGTTPMDHEGTTGPTCKENEEVLKDNENNGAAVMEDERTTGGTEKENRYNMRNKMSNCTAVMSYEETTGESPKENIDAVKNGILEENDGTIILDDKGTEQVVLEHGLNMLEDVSAGVGQTLLSTTKNIIQDELLAAATNDHEMVTTTCGDEPSFPVNEMTSDGQDVEFIVKQDVLSEKQNLHADKVDEDLDEIATEVSQEVSCRSICATVEMSEASFIEEDQEVPTGLEESEMEIAEQRPPYRAATEKPDLNESELFWSSEKEFVANMNIVAINFTDIHNANGNCESDMPITAVSEHTDPAGGDTDNVKKISEPTAPPTGQENHMHCLLDQNACDTSVTPTVAEQQVCNPTLTPAASELPQETDLSGPLLYSLTDSQLHKIASSMELEDQTIPEGYRDHQEDATELVRGLIRELSSMNRTVMAAHREMELLRRGKLPKAPNRRHCGPRQSEM